VIVASVYFFFFFQAEDGIRDLIVTGVQTCALPISVVGGAGPGSSGRGPQRALGRQGRVRRRRLQPRPRPPPARQRRRRRPPRRRSEERRVGKECRSRGAPDDYKEKTGGV